MEPGAQCNRPCRGDDEGRPQRRTRVRLRRQRPPQHHHLQSGGPGNPGSRMKELVDKVLRLAEEMVSKTGGDVVFMSKCPKCGESLADVENNTCHEFMECCICGTTFEVK